MSKNAVEIGERKLKMQFKFELSEKIRCKNVAGGSALDPRWGSAPNYFQEGGWGGAPPNNIRMLLGGGANLKHFVTPF